MYGNPISVTWADVSHCDVIIWGTFNMAARIYAHPNLCTTDYVQSIKINQIPICVSQNILIHYKILCSYMYILFYNRFSITVHHQMLLIFHSIINIRYYIFLNKNWNLKFIGYFPPVTRTFSFLYVTCSTTAKNNINLLPHEHIVKNGLFHWKASYFKFQLLWNYEKCLNTNETWHKCWLNHNLCNSMLNLKFPWGPFQNCENWLLCIVFSIKTEFKMLQLLNAMRYSKRHFSIGYTSP
jgi:hypothetical protein